MTQPSGQRYAYERDPMAIYRQSFAAIESACDLNRYPGYLRDVALRLVHTTGRPEILDQLVTGPEAPHLPALIGKNALAEGKPILCDAKMVASGITTLKNIGNPVRCFLDEPLPDLATTRSARAVELWQPHLAGAVVAIGNAPTALFHLLERLADGWPRPALIIGMPVGFVGAAESKDALIADSPVPFITLRGREGGSALAAATVNALLLAS